MSRRFELRQCSRPRVGVMVAPGAWWKYAVRAAISYRRAHTVQLNWAELQARRRVRMVYVAAYTA
eukprot:6639254-Prymnesium_polylepis.1